MISRVFSIAGLLAAGSANAASVSFSGTLDTAQLDGTGHYILGTADVDGDGLADLVSGHTNGHAYVWPGQSDGRFGSAVSSFSGTLDIANLDGRGHQILGVADVNGDGLADLVSSHENGNAYVWPGKSDGRFGSAVSSFSGTLDMANHDGRGHFMLGLGDVNGDGMADLVSAHDNGNAYVWPGQPDGRFGGATASFDGTLSIANLDGSGHYLLEVADVNGDGNADLVSAHDNGHAYVWLGRDDASFGGAVSSFSGTLDFGNIDDTGHYIVGAADTNDDGRADLISSHANGHVYVWMGQPDGSFGSAASFFGGDFDASNLDGDGHFIVGLGDVTGNLRAEMITVHPDGNAYVWGLDGVTTTEPVDEFVRAEETGSIIMEGMPGYGQWGSGTLEITDMNESDADETGRNLDWLRFLVRFLLAAAEAGSPEVIQLNGAYEGSIRTADGSSSAPVTLQIYQAGRDVAGSMWLTEDTLELDGGLLCPSIRLPVSMIQFDGAGSADVAYGNTVENIKIGLISYELDIAWQIDMYDDLEWAQVTVDIEGPATCSDIQMTGLVRRFSTNPAP
jgi:hypothetical protein